MRTSYSVPALCCCEDCVHAKLWHELEISCSLFNAVSNLCWLGDEHEGSWVSEMVPGALFCWALTFAAVEPHKMQGSLSGHVGALAAFLHWWIKASLPAVNVDKLKKKKSEIVCSDPRSPFSSCHLLPVCWEPLHGQTALLERAGYVLFLT